jgi:HK97 family phage major capsid protein
MKTADLEKLITDKVTAITKDIVVRKGSFYGNDGASSDPKFARIIELHKSASDRAEIVEFQKRADDVHLVSLILGKPAQELKIFKSFQSWLGGISEVSELKKAMTTTGAGTGLEWIPTDFSRQLEDMLNLERMLANAIPRINMSSDPYKIPVKKSRSVARKGTQAVAPTETVVGTAQVTFSASKIITYVPLSYELAEDAIVDMLSVIKSDLVESIAYGEEDAILNGDTTAPHMDSDITSAEDVRKCYKGLRKLALANSWTVDLGTFTSDTIAGMIGQMLKYGLRKNKLLWGAGPKVLQKLMNLRDAQNNNVVITMEKLGQQATMINGQLGILFGSPVVPVESARENLNASGVYDGVTTDNGGLYLVYVPGWKLGERGGITAEMDKVVKAQTIDIVASKREDLQPVHDITTEPIVCMGYNVAV